MIGLLEKKNPFDFRENGYKVKGTGVNNIKIISALYFTDFIFSRKIDLFEFKTLADFRVSG